MPIHKKTKIIATLGPASQTEETIAQLVDNGMNIARLNFSHGTQVEQKTKLQIIRALEKKRKSPIGIIQDLQGPKIRLGELQEEPQFLIKGQYVTLIFGALQQGQELPITTNIFPFLRVGNTVLINDGLIKLLVETAQEDRAICTVMTGGEIRSHKGINLPDTTLPNVALTVKDKNDLLFGLENKVDFVALSFVQTADDILHLRELIAKQQHHPQIIAKIETKSAVKNLDEIIQTADAVMIARGDMAVEIGQEEVPIVQRRIINLARTYNKPVITATQMLESMIHNPQPTRAEVSDIANSVIEHVDALMLSAETALGEYPVEAVTMMNKVIVRIEEEMGQHENTSKINIEDAHDQTTAIAAAAAVLAAQLKARMIFSLTTSGKTARKLSLYRTAMPILAVTNTLLVARQLCLSFGIYPLFKENISDNDAIYAEILHEETHAGTFHKNDRIVMVTGTNPGEEGHTNTIRVTTIV